MVGIKESLKIIRKKLYEVKIDNKDLRTLMTAYTPLIAQSSYSTTDYIRWFVQGLTWGAPVWIPKVYESLKYQDPSRLLQIADYAVNMPIEEWGTGAAGFITSLVVIGILKRLYRVKKVKNQEQISG